MLSIMEKVQLILREFLIYFKNIYHSIQNKLDLKYETSKNFYFTDYF